MDKCTNDPIVSVNYKKAETHYSKSLLRNYFKYWNNCISMTDKKRALLEKSVAFYNIYCLKNCITNWKLYVALQKEKKIIKDKIDKARKFYAKKVLQTFIRIWINSCEFILQKSKIAHAIMHYKSKLLIKYFDAWKIYHEYKLKKLNIEERVSCVNESITEKTMNANIEMFYNFKLVQKTFFAWQDWYNMSVQNSIKNREIRNIFENRKKSIMFDNWRLYIIQKKCKRRKIFTAGNFYEKKLTIKTLKKFYNYAAYRKEKRIRLSYLNDKSKEIMRRLQYIYIEKWRNALYSVIQEKQKLYQATQFWESNVTRKYFFNWIEFSRQYKIKMVRKQELNEIAIGFLLKRFILHWHSKLQDVLYIRKKEFLAISMMEHKILRKYFLLWEQYIAQKVKMNDDVKVAMKLHKQLLLREGLKEILRNSLYNIDCQRDLQLKNAVMRSFQNFEILKEYFDKWHSFVYLKKKSVPVCEITDSDEFQFKRIQIPCNNIYNNFKTCLVLPEYMMNKDTILNAHNSFHKFSGKSWLFDSF
ncbi:uncharacterized protein LOC132914309 isoform X2 [Bombus pascuorum]|uniref:uncharacterized protein LOC132914309 isoform X2 n=1 Tax=Bombus pascuorum TaxID=65598 RepID=UPI00298E6533|nr:uncharacterized protein LOC132914309 isoform X2 [Bombus pascuorum]